MSRIAVIAALVGVAACPPAMAQIKQPDLPRLMQQRSVSSLPAAAPSQTLRYGDAPSQLVEMFLPKDPAADALLPVVVMVHGGCWRSDTSGPELLRAAAASFVEKGYAVWSIGYRRTDEEGGGYPGTFADVGQALDLLRDHAEAGKLDLNRVVLFGHSEGGLLALWAAGRGKLPAGSPMKVENPLKPRGVVSVGGVGSLKTWEAQVNATCGADTIQKLAPGDDDARFADTSPDMLLPTGVPLVMLHGVFDPVAFPAVGFEHVQAARRAGDPAEIQVAPVSGQFEVIAPGNSAFAQALAAIERFAR